MSGADRPWDDVTFEAFLLSASLGADAGIRLRAGELRAAGAYVLEIEPDDAGAAADAVRWLSDRGVTGRLILVLGDDFRGRDAPLLAPGLERSVVVSVADDATAAPPGVLPSPGGARRACELLDGQLARRRARRVPDIDDDPEWVITLPEEPAMERAAEAIGTLANGWVGIRAAPEEGGPGTMPLFAVNGVYGPDGALLPGPVWTGLTVTDGGSERRVDLRTGILVRRSRGRSGLRTFRFVSASRPHAMALRAESLAELDPGDPFAATPECERREVGDVRLARTWQLGGGGITVGVRDRTVTEAGRRIIERLAAWDADPAACPGWDRATDHLAELREVGFDRLLAEHRHAWARRWADAAIAIEGAAGDELAARFATFHVLAAAPDSDEAAVGARALTGLAYDGHVFWDADVYVLPALAAIRPPAARAMLEYRIRRLPAARAAAKAAGLRGARFPWESATDGRDVTPRHIQGTNGELIPIRTGEKEEHIVSAIAWAANEYAAWTGDVEFLAGPGRDLIVDTARYWESRIRVDRDGRAHLYGLMGPDEYHEVVDDNAYTNVMARWNLRRAAALVDELGGDEAERDRWRLLADRLVDGWDPARGLYEQFAGYWSLEPLLVADIAEPPVAADVVLGGERIAASQIIKQADVLMLHHLVPDEVVPGSLAANLAFYEPRTAHGSSLSPAIHAALYARAGQLRRALELFRLAARLDLDDVTGTTAGGLHLATMGGVWQALAYGFLGLRPRRDALDLDPRLPPAWSSLTLGFRFHGAPVTVRADHSTVTLTCVEPLNVRIAGREPATCRPPSDRYELGGARP